MGRSTFWSTKSGDKIAIKSMGTSHILNTIKMLQKNPFFVKSNIFLELKEELNKRKMENEPNDLIKEIL